MRWIDCESKFMRQMACFVYIFSVELTSLTNNVWTVRAERKSAHSTEIHEQATTRWQLTICSKNTRRENKLKKKKIKMDRKKNGSAIGSLPKYDLCEIHSRIFTRSILYCVVRCARARIISRRKRRPPTRHRCEFSIFLVKKFSVRVDCR